MSSTRYAALLAAAYVAIASAYIVVSGHLAAGAAGSIEEMRRTETVKGVLYVVVTALLVFAGARWAMRRQERDAEELRRCEQALVANEGRVFAGLTAASIAHDVNNVLTVALAELDALDQEAPGGAATARLRRVVGRVISLNRRLLDSAQAYATREGTPLDARESAREVLASLGSHADVRRCRVAITGEAGVIIAASATLMHQLLGNLVINAAQAAGDRGQVEVRISRHGDEALLDVHDDGPGVPPERRADLFTALASTKPNGDGLGLFSVAACASGLGGSVEVSDSHLGGAHFRVRLPLATAAAVVTH